MWRIVNDSVMGSCIILMRVLQYSALCTTDTTGFPLYVRLLEYTYSDITGVAVYLYGGGRRPEK